MVHKHHKTYKHNKMIKLFSKSLTSFELKITGLISVLLIALFLLPLYFGGFINLMRSLGAGTVSEAFIDELLLEPESSVMLQKARDAGLTVESNVGDTGESHIIKDSAGITILTSSIHELGIEEVFEAKTANADIVPPAGFTQSGSLASCDAGPGVNVLIKDGKIFGINVLPNAAPNVIRIDPAINMPAGLYDKIDAALTAAKNSINSTLSAYAGDTSQVPRLAVDNFASGPNLKVVFVPLAPTIIGRADYRKVGDNPTGAEHTLISVNINPEAKVSDMTPTMLTNVMIHELGHALGLGHTEAATNVMKSDVTNFGQVVNFSNAQIKALVASHSPHTGTSADINLSNCKVGPDPRLTKNICGADIVLVRDIHDFEMAFSVPGTVPPWESKFVFFEEHYNSFINLYKGLVDNLSDTSSRFAVVDPVSFVSDKNGPSTDGGGQSALRDYLFYDQYVRLGFSGDPQAVKTTLEGRPLWLEASREPYRTTMSSPPGLKEFIVAFNKYAALKYEKIQSILPSGRDDYPNLIIYVSLGKRSVGSVLYYYSDNGPTGTNWTSNGLNLDTRQYFGPRGWLQRWPLDAAHNITSRNINIDGGRVVIGYDTIPVGRDSVLPYPFNYIGVTNTGARGIGVRTFNAVDTDTLTSEVEKAINEFCVLPDAPPTVDEVSITPGGSASVESPNIFSALSNSANAATNQHTIKIYSSDYGGAKNINRINAVINREGVNAGSYRGYFTWSKDEAPYTNGKDQRSCTGGGYAAINPDSKYGPSYVTLNSCSITSMGNNKIATFTFTLNPSFTSPATNTISGSAENDLGNLGWKSDFLNVTLNVASQDTIPPTVEITNPNPANDDPNVYGTHVTGTGEVTATAADNEGIVGVQFKLDGNNLGPEDTSAPYSTTWNASIAPFEEHTLTAVARDIAGNLTTSSVVDVSNHELGYFSSPATNTISLSGSGTYDIILTQLNITAGVQFKLDGNNLGPEDTSEESYKYTFTASTMPSAGPHTISAIVRDPQGFKYTISKAVIVVADTTPPAVSIASPINNSTVAGTITLTATATDNVGVVGVRFKYGAGYLIGPEDTTAPYSMSWNTAGGSVPNGTYSLTATARDLAGNTKDSSAITVIVNNIIKLGQSNILSSGDYGKGNVLSAQKVTLSQTATIKTLSFYVNPAFGKLRLGIYDATGPSGGPGNKKAETNEITPITGWNTANVVSQVSLPAGNYWLAYLPSSNTAAFRKISSGSAKSYPYTYGVMPAKFSTTPTSSTTHWSFYGTLQP